MKQRLGLSLVLAAGALVACSDSSNYMNAPADPSTNFRAIQVSPNSVQLSTVAPSNTVALTVTVQKFSSGPLPIEEAVITYESSAPATASVSESGVVTAGVPGSAVITVAMTIEDVTRTADVAVVVRAPGTLPSVSGVYDLTATILDSDPVWGIPNGTLQFAVITLQNDGSTTEFQGTFDNFPGGPDDPNSSGAGSVAGTVEADGHVVMELTFTGSGSSYWYGSGELTGQGITGAFGSGGHISGSFIAIRR